MLSTRLTIIAFLAAAWCWTSDGQLYNVACPGVNSKLQCPEGQVIEVLSMQHGVKSSATCSARSQPATVSDKDCIHVGMLGWVKLVCNNMERCRLPKPHPKMFVCDHAKNNFIQITYNCTNRRANERTTVICEGQAAEIKCGKGVLNIVKASFGRFDKETCTETPSKMTFCTSFTTGGRVKKMCNSKQACKITAVPDILGKPVKNHCDSLPKYLTVDYVCQ